MKTLHINVANKIATYRKRDGAIVCGNKDYELEFHFDEEWGAYSHKIARFVWNGQYYDCDFYGDKCSIPMIQGATEVHVGVYAGDLCTTTSAVIPSVPSILCETSVPQPESGQNYTDEAREAAREAMEAASRAEGLLIEHDAEELQYRKQINDTLTSMGEDIEDLMSGGGSTGGVIAYTVGNFLTLYGCINEHVDVEMNGDAVTPAVFRHGDVFRVREEGVPDFWFESAASIYDESELDQHDHTYIYGGEDYDLTVYGPNCLGVLGYLHPVKGTSADPVDLDGLEDLAAVLDYTIAMQEALINGKTDAGASPVRIGDYYFQIEDGSFWEDYLKGDTMFTKEGEYVKVKSLYSGTNKVFVVNEDGDRVKTYDAIVPFGSYALMMDGQEFVIFSVEGMKFIAKRNMKWSSFIGSDYSYPHPGTHGFSFTTSSGYVCKSDGSAFGHAAVYLPGTTTKFKSSETIIGGAEYPCGSYVNAW